MMCCAVTSEQAKCVGKNYKRNTLWEKRSRVVSTTEPVVGTTDAVVNTTEPVVSTTRLVVPCFRSSYDFLHFFLCFLLLRCILHVNDMILDASAIGVALPAFGARASHDIAL